MNEYESRPLCVRGWQHGRLRGGAGSGLAKLLVEQQGLGQGPRGVAGPFTSAHKMAAAVATVLAALSVGDNGLISKTDSLLRGNAKPASELIKQLLRISEGAACLMSSTEKKPSDRFTAL